MGSTCNDDGVCGDDVVLEGVGSGTHTPGKRAAPPVHTLVVVMVMVMVMMCVVVCPYLDNDSCGGGGGGDDGDGDDDACGV